MRAAGLWFALIAGGAAWGQNVVSDWLPLRTGDTWVYQHDTRDQIGANEFEKHSWKTEETVAGSWNTPEGVLVGMRVRVIGTPRSNHQLTADPAYFIRGACVYGYWGEAAWNPVTHRPGADFLKGLTGGWDAPDFCFPLTVGKTWGAPHGLPDWHVSRPELAKDWKVADVVGSTFHITNISGYPGSGMTVGIWFEKGVGIVREEDIHHGTIGEERTRLLRFESGQRR